MRNPEVVKQEMHALIHMLERRYTWLSKRENKMRDTYQAVLRDTRKMEIQLIELKQEYKELLQTKN